MALTILASGCRPSGAAPGEGQARPNFVWVVWDTVRADRLSLYGYPKPTTPKLEAWAREARVFEDCVSTAGSTVPSHASMFTGLLPSEHGTNNEHQHLDDAYDTVAELLKDAGYQTYLFAANPHISSDENFQQGFDVEEHPWDPKYRAEALRIVQAKVMPQDQSSELARKIRQSKATPWNIKASGELAQRGALEWLAQRDAARPFFIFLNYMEAHRPFLPPEVYRRRMMTPAQVEQSYLVDRSWLPMWAYTFGLKEYTSEELEAMAATYDATLAELDDLFASLLDGLRTAGCLDNTVVILTADHGEHLGEHHMLDHQYALYNPLLKVPMVVWYPKRFAAGRDPRPVMNFDLFPTVLELAGIPIAGQQKIAARSLLNPAESRQRIAEYPTVFKDPIRDVRKAYPKWDPTPWLRTFRALFDGPEKFIWASDGQHELYDLARDPGEQRNLAPANTDRATALGEALAGLVQAMAQPASREHVVPDRSEEQKKRLEDLGYAGDEPESIDEPEGDGPRS